MPPEVVARMEQFRMQLDAHDQAQGVRMARAWELATRDLVGEYERVAQEIADRQARGLPVSRWHIQRLERYQSLLRQIDAKQRELAPVMVNEITSAQEELARLGLEHSQALLDFSAPGIVGQFDRLPVTAFQNMVGNTSAGGPLGRLLRESWGQNAGAVGDALVRGVGLGWHPTRIAIAMRMAADMNLARAIVISRNESLRVYRAASLEQYRASDVIDGWIWKASLSIRTCPACLAKDGSFHPIDEDFGSHVQCRCTPMPHVRGVPMPTFERGSEWLARQDDATQRAILGPGRLAAYRAGVPFERFATVHHDPVWGASVSVTPVRDLAA